MLNFYSIFIVNIGYFSQYFFSKYIVFDYKISPENFGFRKKCDIARSSCVWKLRDKIITPPLFSLLLKRIGMTPLLFSLLHSILSHTRSDYTLWQTPYNGGKLLFNLLYDNFFPLQTI